MHNELDEIACLVARETEEDSALFVNLTCWCTVVAMEWTKD
jgi:hypothetical protein